MEKKNTFQKFHFEINIENYKDSELNFLRDVIVIRIGKVDIRFCQDQMEFDLISKLLVGKYFSKFRLNIDRLTGIES